MSPSGAGAAATRLSRCQLSVPGSRPALFEKAAKSEADVVLLDLEDSVAPDDKNSARADVIAAIGDIDWGAKTLSVRVNGADTPYLQPDLTEILERSSERLDLLMFPKVGAVSDVRNIEAMVTQAETAKGRKKKVGFEFNIESAAGMMNIEAIAGASPRTESLHFGPGDYAASIHARTTQIGAPNPDYGILTDADEDGARAFHWGDMWHYALSRLIVAARAHGLRPLDGPYANFSDAEGTLAQARRSAALGCEGKWAIHPSQIEPINRVFSPTEDEVAQARAIVAAMAAAASEGQGAATLDGRMIDIASLRQAEVLVKKAALIAGAT